MLQETGQKCKKMNRDAVNGAGMQEVEQSGRGIGRDAEGGRDTGGYVWRCGRVCRRRGEEKVYGMWCIGQGYYVH